MKKYIGYVCLYYTFLISYITLNGNLGNYLAPNMHINVYLSAIVLFIMGAILLREEHNHYQFKPFDIILLLPILFLVFAKDGQLDTNIANTKQSKMGMSTQIIKKNNPTKETKIDGIDYDVVDESYIQLSGDLTYNAKIESIKGKTIKVRGFIIKKDEFIPKGYFAIGKLLVSCCTADSGFGGFVAKYDLTKIKEKGWYEIIGVMDSTKDPFGNEIGYIDVKEIKSINSKSEKMYVYPCLSYGNNACNILDTYDYEYKYQ
ncbi:MAG: TIGR03943 family protein [Bacilli bacterium]|nr:TIGR03943 family protein [Bacilli bacterium]